jgi:hypothetical protein
MNRLFWAGLLLVLISLIALRIADPSSSRLLFPLLISGGVAGVAQSLIENKNRIALPGPADAGQYNLGFIADILIGMVGAFASLIIGLAVLNERFFHDSTGDDGNPKAFTDLIQQIPTWVRVASFGTLTGFASRRLLPDLSNRVANLVSGAIQTEVKKQAQSQLEATRSQAELLGMVAEATRPQAHAPAGAQRGIAAEDPALTPIARLSAIVERYTAVVGDDDQGLVIKRQLADEMLALILRLGITAQDLLPHITPQANDRDGWLVALASLVAVAPAPGDGSRLLELAPLASQDFAKYRILLAIYSLKVRGRLTAAETAQARPFVLECIKSKNEMLARKARSVLEFLDKV